METIPSTHTLRSQSLPNLQRLVLPILEFHVDGITQYVFCVWLLLLTLRLCDPGVTYGGCDFVSMTLPALLYCTLAPTWSIHVSACPGCPRERSQVLRLPLQVLNLPC